jgi:hypothetical protein
MGEQPVGDRRDRDVSSFDPSVPPVGRLVLRGKKTLRGGTRERR